jgi:hypothetical protein
MDKHQDWGLGSRYYEKYSKALAIFLGAFTFPL